MREIFKSQFLKVEVFLPFFVGWSGSSSLTAWNRKASTLWRGGALLGKLRTRCHQARGLGPSRGHHHHREPSAQHVGGRHAWEREGGELLVHRRGPGPGSRRSSLEKPSSTRAGGRGERWGVPHCLEEKEKTKSWVNARNFQVSIIVRKNLCPKKSILGCEEKI